MNGQEQLMDNLLNVDLEIIEHMRGLQEANRDSDSLKQQVGDLLKIRDEMVAKLMESNGQGHSCDCGHDHHHE